VSRLQPGGIGNGAFAARRGRFLGVFRFTGLTDRECDPPNQPCGRPAMGYLAALDSFASASLVCAANGLAPIFS
jgi:hypothetical protein